MKPPKLYLDTTIYDALSHDEMREVSQNLLDQCAEGQFQLCLSALLTLEVSPLSSGAAALEQQLASAAVIPVTESVLRMREAYLQTQVVPVEAIGAAMHVAVASAGGAKLFATWRFDEILRHTCLPRFNALNEAWGFPHLPMHTPLALLNETPTRFTWTKTAPCPAIPTAIADMPLEQELAYWAEKTAELQERQKQLKKELKKAEKAEAKTPEKAGAK